MIVAILAGAGGAAAAAPGPGDADRDLSITRHWRLASVHAWLTLQLRYLVFHGPCTLVLRGTRGVRIEAAESGRLVTQAATLACSANLAYSNRRCETFVPCWTGAQDLFNDAFEGGPGVFAYEEFPSRVRTSGIGGRGLEGITDALLKVFGI